MAYDFHQFLIENLLDPLDRWRLGEAATQRYQRQFEQTQFLSQDALAELQLQQLQKLLGHAYEYCPYYRDRWDQLGFQPGDLRQLSDLEHLPVLEKADIQRHREEMASRDVRPGDRIRNQTGGSTGSPLAFYVSRDRMCSREAAARRHNRWAGWKVGDKVALVWGASPDLPTNSWKARLRNQLLDRRLVLDTSSVTDAKIRQFHQDFERFRPKIVLAYAQSLVLITKHMMATGLQLKHRPLSIVSSAEVLSDEDRQLVEAFYGCNVFNRYGCREVSVIASECEQHDGLHVMAEGLYVEILDGHRPVTPGTIGSVVVTDLCNMAMPLIRYRNGDLSSLHDQPCACGRHLPRLKSLEGRATDFLVADDGRLVSGPFLANFVLAYRPGLGQVQMVQREREQVCFYFTGIGQSSEQMAEDIQFLRTAVARYLGPRTRFDYQLVESIPNSASGKYAFCKSEVAADLALSH